MFSNSCIYALRAVLYLAEQASAQNRLGVKSMAATLEIPEPYLAKVLQILARFGVVTSVKGPGGGFYLTEEQLAMPILRVVEVTDGLGELMRCVMGFTSCSTDNPCFLHNSFSTARHKVMHQLSHHSIRESAQNQVALLVNQKMA
ncbi:MAG TPA: Rrf2 family transcriptional regulator [Rhodothermales bacterium]|nr:Rrf2 family transcriptional regulator [Rhodothermales bacterium]HRR08288.1 Rrf2 family transcriptional regulator [Rhodothermales bacterium]